MGKFLSLMCAYVSIVVFFLAGFGITLWIGVSALVPQAPWHERNITAGVCLVVFSTLIGIVSGMIGGFFCGGVCYLGADDMV
jgi:hypothetical protein